MSEQGREGRERDLVLAFNQQANIQDSTKGHVNVYVGPTRASMAQTDWPVRYNSRAKKFEKCSLEEAIVEFVEAPEGWYIVLQNPAADTNRPHPPAGSSTAQVPLQVGRKVNIPGPVSLPLWPGQAGEPIEGHRLRSNQYLVVRVYNDEAARENWGKSVIKTVDKPADGGDKPADGGEAAKVVCGEATKLTMGRLIIIKGTEVSFYMPPTGIEVVPDRKGYVRDAVTLERLEYCILLDESGDTRIVKGPDVVFPEPTETFIEKDGERKFKAIELNEDMGLLVKVIVEYEEGGKTFKTGDELFITGKDQRLYYPRQEHAIIKYGDRLLHYGVAIPEGEGRYVLDKRQGKVVTRKGPQILLADPRHEAIVQRILEDREVDLFYPGNKEARDYNARLRAQHRGTADLDEAAADLAARKMSALAGQSAGLSALTASAGEFVRHATYTPPRTITLDNKYDGAVTIGVWSGYAVLCINKTGGRRVEVGPKTVLLDYDETLQVLELSTGKPKNTDHTQRTTYLMVHNNHVSDIADAVTQDMVGVKVKLSYRVNFEGDPEKWFEVENYVKLLCDHTRSRLRHAIKQIGIEQFSKDAVSLIRDTILGKPTEGAKRPGLPFEENGMRIYDVEVLAVEIGDEKIAGMLTSAQHQAVSQTLDLAANQRALDLERRKQEIQRQTEAAKAETFVETLKLELLKAQKQAESEKAKAEAKTAATVLQEELKAREWQAQHDQNLARLKAEAADKLAALAREIELFEKAHADAMRRLAAATEEAEQKNAQAMANKEVWLAQELKNLELKRAQSETEYECAKRENENRLAVLKAEVDALVEKAKAISPDLIAALQAFGDRELTAKALETLAPLAIMQDKTVVETARKLLDGTIFTRTLPGNGSNGSAHRELER